MDRKPPVPLLIHHGTLWVRSQRDLHRPSTRSLSQQERLALSGFFDPEILEKARIIVVPVIQNPSFYSDLEQMGLYAPPDFTTMTGITYDDTILVSEARFPPLSHWISLLFHELAHVVQYDLLGVEEFMAQYVRGWATNGFDYYSIPLEWDAYELQARYDPAPGGVFSVAEEVVSRLRKS